MKMIKSYWKKTGAKHSIVIDWKSAVLRDYRSKHLACKAEMGQTRKK